MVFENESLKFPLKCHYKVIAEDIQGLDFVLETVLLELKVNAPVGKGNKSDGGKYVTYNIEIMVDSMEMMNKIDAALRNVRGVRMVL